MPHVGASDSSRFIYTANKIIPQNLNLAEANKKYLVI